MGSACDSVDPGDCSFFTVEGECQRACESSGRVYVRNSASKDAVGIVAVSKSWPAAHVRRCAYVHGQRVFGENYVDELLDKAAALPSDCQWHFIGRLQTNKLARLLSAFAPPAGATSRLTIQTIDSTSHAVALNRAAERHNYGRRSLCVYIQVNVSGEASKGGVAPECAADVALHIQTSCPCLWLCGLMAIGSGDPVEFGRLASLAESISKLKSERIHSEIALEDSLSGALLLSMGMSADYCDAISAGSNLVRIGTAIFGGR